MGDTAIMNLPVKLLSRYGTLEGLARTAADTTTNPELRDAIRETLAEIDRLWDNRKEKP